MKPFFVALLLASPLACADTLVGKVIGVADGDTITVLDSSYIQHRVRLAGIDAPERRQPFGTRARQHLADAVYQKHVVVEWHKRDRYDRMIGKVILDGADAGLGQIRAGLAWWYRAYVSEQRAEDRAAYEAAERQARESVRGLWRDEKPVAPWEWRKSARSAR